MNFKKACRRLIASALAATMMISSAVTSFAITNPYTDVKTSDWYYDYVLKAYEDGIMSGVGNNKFEPEGTLTREQFVVILAKLSDADLSDYDQAESEFSDVSSDEWYSPYITWATKNKITSGIGNGKFGLGQSVTREQIAVFIQNYVTLTGDTLPESSESIASFKDASSVSSWAADAVEAMRVSGIFVGDENGCCNPQSITTRAQAATISCKLKEVLKQSEEDNEPVEEGLVYDLVVKNGKATDLVSGKTYSDITVSGEYMKGGTIKLSQSYTNWTYQMIVDYNEEATDGIINWVSFTSNSGKYEECSNVFKLKELSSTSDRGNICIPWVKDSWYSGYVMSIPIQLYSHASTSYEYLPTGDTFWSFSMDSDNGTLNARIDGATATATMSTYTDKNGNTKYVDKILPSSLTLSKNHAVKEIKIYDRALSTDEQKKAYEATGITAPTNGITKITDTVWD